MQQLSGGSPTPEDLLMNCDSIDIAAADSSPPSDEQDLSEQDLQDFQQIVISLS